jgi:hypothetical protein
MLGSRPKEADLADTPCPHCGELHAGSPTVCPKTGGAIAPEGGAPASAGGAPEKGVADILGEAWALYRKHARALLMTCAVLFVPAAVVKSCAFAAIMGPTIAAGEAVGAAASSQGAELESNRAALQEAYQRHADGATIKRLQDDQARLLKEMGRRSAAAASAAMGGFTVFVLGIFGALVTFFIYAVTVPLTNGALTIAVADRVTGGNAEWREVWMLLLRRLGPLLTAIIPAAIITAFGFVLFIIPGLVFGLLFAFVSPVVLIEGLRGRAALRRSLDLVSGDWLRVAIMITVLAVLRWFAQLVASMVLPTGALFFGSLFADLVTLVFLPLPVLGMVLLYFDVRRKRDNFTDDRLRADLVALRTS